MRIGDGGEESRSAAVDLIGIDVGVDLDLGPFREPAFDPRPSLGVGLSGGVANRLLELSVLPLLSVPQNSSLPVQSAELSRLRRRRRRRRRRRHPRNRIAAGSGFAQASAERIGDFVNRVPVGNNSDIQRRRGDLKLIIEREISTLL